VDYSSVDTFKASDAYLLPLYLIFFVAFYRLFLRKKFASTGVNKYIAAAFIFKVCLTIIQMLILEVFYNGEGDMKGYFINCVEANNFLVERNVSLLKYYLNLEEYFRQMSFSLIPTYSYNSATVNVMYFVLPFFRIANESFLITSIFCSMFAFLGSISLFNFFVSVFPNQKGIAAISAFYLPSFSLWSAGLFKETIAIGAMGLLTYSVYKLLKLKQSVVLNSLVCAFSLFVIYWIKPYILFLLLGVFIVAYKEVIVKLADRKIAAMFIRLFSVGIVAALVYLYLNTSKAGTDDVLSGLTSDVILDNIASSKNSYADRGTLSLGEFDPNSPMSALKLFPLAIFTCFFRPFLWEAGNILGLVNALESCALFLILLIVLYKYRLKFFSSIYRNNYLFAMCIFALLFGGVVTLPTGNFGTLVRYKAPCLPFFAFLLLYLYSNRNSFAKRI
jgi:hypothetical protein